MKDRLENLPFGESSQIFGCTIERIVIGTEAGWMIRCGKNVLNTRYIEKAISFIEQHYWQEVVSDSGER
jgi:hypothetical protein